jgi:AraC family transcriptional regulator
LWQGRLKIPFNTARLIDGITTVMKLNDRSANPDFFVQWRNASARSTQNIYCVSSEEKSLIPAKGELRKVIATLHTSTTHIELSEVSWSEPTIIEFTPHRLGFCSLISNSSSLIEYGYRETTKSGHLGHILFMLPGKAIRSVSAPGTIRAVTCSFDPEYAGSVVGPLVELSQSQLSSSLDVRSSLISAVLLRLMHEALYPGPLSSAVVESFGHSLLVECAHWLLNAEPKLEMAGKLTARHFAIIEEYLAGLSGELPSVAQLAAACGFSERYFAKLFRGQMGCSVAQYIKSAQITKAKSYLLETDLALKEIAYRLGFSTPANFSSAFRAATGSTPGQFRKSE